MARVSVSISVVDEGIVESVSQLLRERLLMVLARKVCVDVRKAGEYRRMSRELRESVRRLGACISELRALGDCENGYEIVRLFERLRLENMEKGIRLCLMIKETQCIDVLVLYQRTKEDKILSAPTTVANFGTYYFALCGKQQLSHTRHSVSDVHGIMLAEMLFFSDLAAITCVANLVWAYGAVGFALVNVFVIAKLPTDRATLDEYMGVWLRNEVSDMVEIRSMVVIFCKQLEEMIESRRLVIDHLEKVRGCPTQGWLKRLKENHAEDLGQLGILNVFVARMEQTMASLPEYDREYARRINALLQEMVVAYDERVDFIWEMEFVPGVVAAVKTAKFLNENL
ncbi:hypothetical protein Tco_0702114 [Tanacetum coccineum]|uniref:Uncharacterized protein n=1 Tax=Tanacetum coccineum TaxID=301880 RepID=A0ABQ4XX17_9ASTR